MRVEFELPAERRVEALRTGRESAQSPLPGNQRIRRGRALGVFGSDGGAVG